jgi:hypothetical protein
VEQDLTLDGILQVPSTLANGTYTLFTYGGTLTDNGMIVTGATGVLTYSGNQIQLVIGPVMEPFLEEASLNGPDISVKIQSMPDKTYTLEFRNELSSGDWADVPGSAQVGNGSVLTLTDPSGGMQPHRFYRVRITP